MARTYRRSAPNRAIDAFESFRIRRGLGGGNRRLLTVVGRKSGATYSTPVTVLELDGAQYLVAPFGGVAWVRNAMAAGEVTLSRGSKAEVFRIEPVDGIEAGRVLKAYVKLEPITKPYFEVPATASEAEFASLVEAHPVFRLVREQG